MIKYTIEISFPEEFLMNFLLQEAIPETMDVSSFPVNLAFFDPLSGSVWARLSQPNANRWFAYSSRKGNLYLPSLQIIFPQLPILIQKYLFLHLPKTEIEIQLK